MTGPFNRSNLVRLRADFLLRWLVTASLLAALATPQPVEAGAATVDTTTSVLELQRLVDSMLLAPELPRGGRINVLDLQRALLDTVHPEPSRDERAPSHQDDAVLPVSVRLPLHAAPAPDRVFAPRISARTAPVSPPPAGMLPADSGPRVRYQYYLLSNAPPERSRMSIADFFD